jgi:hypothetical protein
MTTSAKVVVNLKGPFFKNRDRIMAEAINDAVNNLVELGEQRLDMKLRPKPMGVFKTRGEAGRQASTGNYRRNVHGDVRKVHSLRGSQKTAVGRIHDSGMVYGPWLEGTSSRNRTTRFKGYAQFRKTKQWLDKKSDGIAKHHVNRARRRLNGM